MRTQRFMSFLALIVLLSLAGCAPFHMAEPPPEPYEVTFRVEGSSAQAMVALYTPSNPKGDWISVGLPFTKVETVPRDKMVMLSARHIEGETGPLTATVSVDGKVVKSATTSDPNKHATAQISLASISQD